MNLKEKFASYLTKIGVEDGKVASLFNDDGTELNENAIDFLIKHDASRVKTFKEEGTKLFDQGHQKGVLSTAQKLEKEIKDKFKVDSEKSGVDLIEEIIASKATQSDGVIDENKIKTHPTYVSMQDELKSKIKETEKSWKEKYEGFEKSITKENLFKEVMSSAKGIVSELKPILPSDQKKAERQMQLLVNDLKGYDFTKTEDGKDFIISKDGKPIEDSHGNRLKLDNIVRNTASEIWDFEHGDSRSSGGNDNDDKGGASTKWNGKVPSNDNEYIQAINNAKDATEKMAITDAYYQEGAK